MINVFKFIKHKVAPFMFVLLVVCLALPQIGIANEIKPLDVDRSCSLNLIYKSDETPIAGASFQLYFVADVDENVDLELANDFASSGVDLSYDDSDKWADDASTLSAYITLEGTKGVQITPVATGVTDSQGKIEFDKLQTGVYLLTGDVDKVGGVEYTPADTLIMLPTIQSDDSADYSPVVYPKEITNYGKDDENKETTETTTSAPTPSTPSSPSTSTDDYYLNVVKIWSDTGYESVRPSSVTVVLMQDGKQYDKVVLSKDNNWRYRWENLNKDSKWELAEENVPTNYTVTSVLDGNSFIVTNTRTRSGRSGSGTKRTEGTPKVTTEATTEATTATKSPNIVTDESTPNDDNPVIPDEPTEVTTNEFDEDIPRLDDDPDEISEEGEDDEIVTHPGGTPSSTPVSTPTSSKSSGNLPQTGQLWWPIPMLLICGLVFLMLGDKLSGGKNDNQD